jgi:hypothetical protein
VALSGRVLTYWSPCLGTRSSGEGVMAADNGPPPGAPTGSTNAHCKTDDKCDYLVKWIKAGCFLALAAGLGIYVYIVWPPKETPPRVQDRSIVALVLPYGDPHQKSVKLSVTELGAPPPFQPTSLTAVRYELVLRAPADFPHRAYLLVPPALESSLKACSDGPVLGDSTYHKKVIALAKGLETTAFKVTVNNNFMCKLPQGYLSSMVGEFTYFRAPQLAIYAQRGGASSATSKPLHLCVSVTDPSAPFHLRLLTNNPLPTPPKTPDDSYQWITCSVSAAPSGSDSNPPPSRAIGASYLTYQGSVTAAYQDDKVKSSIDSSTFRNGVLLGIAGGFLAMFVDAMISLLFRRPSS